MGGGRTWDLGKGGGEESQPCICLLKYNLVVEILGRVGNSFWGDIPCPCPFLYEPCFKKKPIYQAHNQLINLIMRRGFFPLMQGSIFNHPLTV